MATVTAQKVADIVRDAGGVIVGRTRLQKVSYLLVATGLEDGLPFIYKHYGPYCEPLANSARDADLLGLVTEEEHAASWGGTYSIYRVNGGVSNQQATSRQQLAFEAANADAIVLELAATAVFLKKEEAVSDPWSETERRKPEKATPERVAEAKALLQRLDAIPVPQRLPQVF